MDPLLFTPSLQLHVWIILQFSTSTRLNTKLEKHSFRPQIIKKTFINKDTVD